MRENHRLRVFKNGALRKIFGPERKTVIKYITKWAGHVACTGHRRFV
jgi:hypothetical protein